MILPQLRHAPTYDDFFALVEQVHGLRAEVSSLRDIIDGGDGRDAAAMTALRDAADAMRTAIALCDAVTEKQGSKA